MIKTVVFSLMTVIFLGSCGGTGEKRDSLAESESLKRFEYKRLNLSIDSDSTLAQWVNYHKEKNPDFSLADFEWRSTDSLMMMPGHVLGNFDVGFDTMYADLLIYNSSRNLYLDFDSYTWSLDDNGKPSFAADQEINVIDIKGKTVNRIGFNGPSHWVEDGFWSDDSTIVLLQNDYEKRPEIIRIRLHDRKKDVYQYVDTLKFQSQYSQFRFKKKGITK